MKQQMLLLLLPAALLGCAGPAPKQEATTTSADGTVCERDEITGTRFTAMRCRSAAQRERDKRSADDLEDIARRGQAVTRPGST
jgi:hypothetical protein